ncbi:hypothetical protein QBC35DRAFT_75286 [Podospora australis]|uniref:Uncharacterized protein n=1 Tax=Podospora australis TaxID=1536484 RepID=A0AAN7AL09_9PEZI|nr:hypothetical protein QBC35DRAFT_75286 [Podospora australis]
MIPPSFFFFLFNMRLDPASSQFIAFFFTFHFAPIRGGQICLSGFMDHTGSIGAAESAFVFTVRGMVLCFVKLCIVFGCIFACRRLDFLPGFMRRRQRLVSSYLYPQRFRIQRLVL